MPLLTTADIERELNITLTDPNGPETVNHLIASVISWAENRIGHKLERREVVDAFDGGDGPYYLSNPINPELTSVETFDYGASLYTPYAGTYRLVGSHLGLSWAPYAYPGVVQVRYQAGWTEETFPQDLKQALIEQVAAKFLATTKATSEGEIKRVTVGAYTAEYATSVATKTDSVAPNIVEVVDRYRRPIVI